METISLRALLDRLPAAWGTLAWPADDLDSVYITGVAEDSRRVGPGKLFLARRGRGTDGHGYIPTALAAGAVAGAGGITADGLPRGPPPGNSLLAGDQGRTTFPAPSPGLSDL